MNYRYENLSMQNVRLQFRNDKEIFMTDVNAKFDASLEY